MKSRPVSSIFWDKRLAKGYSPTASYLYLYLLTCKHIELTPYFFLADGYIPLETGLSPKDVEKAKAELQERGQVFFYEGWVYIPNADEHNSFNSSPKTKVAYDKQMEKVPPEVLAHFEEIKDQLTDRVSIPYPYGSDTRNSNSNNSSNSNNKGDSKGGYSLIHSQAKQVLEKWNEVHGTRFTSTASIETNLQEWLKEYTLEDILQGVETTKIHHFWKDKLNPTVYLRRGNPRGERVDYIGEMLNYQPKKEFAEADTDKYKNL